MNGINGNLPDFNTMTPAQFEQYLPDLFASGSPNISGDPRLQGFLGRNPDCAALVRDLEAIAKAAMDLFPVQEPSDDLWFKIEKKLSVGTQEV